MKMVRMILVAGLVLGFMACGAQAEGKKKAKVSKVNGTVTAVSDASITVKPVKKNAEEVTVNINEETKIKVNGKKATAGDIEEGMKVMVQYNETAAISIMAKSDPRKDKDKNKKKDKPAEPKE